MPQKLPNTRIKILAYGTLRKGNYNFHPSYNYHSTVVIRGYKMYSFGGYPGCIFTGNPDDLITCDIIDTDLETSQQIDLMELRHNYAIIPITVSNHNCKLYLYNQTEEDMDSKYSRIANGDWNKYLNISKL